MTHIHPNIADGLKTYFVVKDRNDFSIAKIVVASCKTGDFSACGKALFHTHQQLRKEFPHEKYIIDALTTPKFNFPVTLDKSLIDDIVIP